MGDLAGAMQLIGTGTSMAGTIGNSIAQSNAMRLQGHYASDMGKLNAQMADLQAQSAIARGDAEAARLGMKTRQLVGAQRASAAAQGVDVRSGSPAQLQADALAMSRMDQMTLRNNAYKEAMGLQMESSNERFRADMAARTGQYSATQALTAGSLNAFGQGATGVASYYRYAPPARVPSSVTSYEQMDD